MRQPPHCVIVAATGVEAQAVRRAMPRAELYECGVGLRRGPVPACDLAIACGLAGALRAGLPTGTVLIPRSVALPDGTVRCCDPGFVERAIAVARGRGYDVCDEPMLTAPHLVHGADRAHWASRGYAAVDMETALMDAPAIACVRVVLDTPEREISPAWTTPVRAIFTPSAWRDLPFLAREGPRCAARAAEVIRG